MSPRAAMTPAAADAVVNLNVLGGFSIVTDAGTLHLPHHAERVLAFLALQNRPQPRAVLAAALWTDADEARAAANLRTAIWRIRAESSHLVLATGRHLQLGPAVRVDLDAAIYQARELLGVRTLARPAASSAAATHATDDATDAGEIALNADLLPHWEDDWVMFERERLRQLRIHTLEALCLRLSADGRPAGAIEAGRRGVSLEPLRESGREALIRAYLAGGDLVAAVRELRSYRTLLRAELGINPAAELERLVLEAAAAQRAPRT